MKKLTFALGLLTIACSTNATEITPGLYQINISIENPTIGLSRKQSVTECITADEFANGPRAFMNQQQQDSVCTMQNYSIENGNITMNMACEIPGGGKAQVKGTGKYTKDTFLMTNKMIMEAAGIKMEMQTTADAKRTGDC